MSPPRGLHLKSPPETAVRKHTGKGCNVSTALVAAARRCIPRAVVVADPEDGERWTCLPKVRATDAHADWCIANGLPALLALCRGNSAACLRVAVGRCHPSPLPDSSPLVQHLRGGGWCDGGCAARCKGPGDQPRRGLATANLIASKSPVRGRATDSSPCPMHCAGRIAASSQTQRPAPCLCAVLQDPLCALGRTPTCESANFSIVDPAEAEDCSPRAHVGASSRDFLCPQRHGRISGRHPESQLSQVLHAVIPPDRLSIPPVPNQPIALPLVPGWLARIDGPVAPAGVHLP